MLTCSKPGRSVHAPRLAPVLISFSVSTAIAGGGASCTKGVEGEKERHNSRKKDGSFNRGELSC